MATEVVNIPKNQQQTVALQLKTSCRAVAREGEERRGEERLYKCTKTSQISRMQCRRCRRRLGRSAFRIIIIPLAVREWPTRSLPRGCRSHVIPPIFHDIGEANMYNVRRASQKLLECPYPLGYVPMYYIDPSSLSLE
jgi:hypothetical protein